jgi:hypothetical protein
MGDLIVPNPDAFVQVVECEDMVKKWLRLRMTSRTAEDLHEHWFEELQMRKVIECPIERENRTRSFETVSRQLQLRHRVNWREREKSVRRDGPGQ